MKRATITLTDDLEAAVEAYLAEQEAPPSLTSLVQAALRRFLTDRRLEREEGTPGPSEIAEEPGVYETGRGSSAGVVPGGGKPSEPRHGRLNSLRGLLAGLPRLSDREADELASDLEEAREELSRQALADPWSPGGPLVGSEGGSSSAGG